MIESGLQQLKSILALEAEGETHVVHKPTTSSPGHGDYMSEDEEEALDKMLEEDRKQLAAEHAKKMAQFWKEDEA